MGGTSPLPELNGHVVIINSNDKVKHIIESLQNPQQQNPLDIILMVQDRKYWNRQLAWHPETTNAAQFFVLEGSPTNKADLAKLRLATARAAIILADPKHGTMADAPSTFTTMAIENENPQVHTIIELVLSVNRKNLLATNVNEVVCIGEISEKLIAQNCVTPGIKYIFDNLMDIHENTPQVFIADLPEYLTQRSFKQLSRTCIQADAPFILIGFIRSERKPLGMDSDSLSFGQRDLLRNIIINPRKDGALNKNSLLIPGDQIITIGYEPPRFETVLTQPSNPI